MACDLASLRGLAGPGRGELIESLTPVLAQGSVLGYGRAVAEAMREVLIGNELGVLPPGVPEPALLTHTRHEAQRLGLPHQERAGTASVRVEPFSGPKELARHIFLERLDALAIPYRTDDSTIGSTRGLENRSRTEFLSWRTTTTAALSLLGASGVTLEQATDLTLLSRLHNGATPLSIIGLASRAGSDRALSEALDLLDISVLGFASAVKVTELLTSIAGGRQPAAAVLEADTVDKCAQLAATLTSVILRELEGITTSDDIDDARMLGTTAALLTDHSTQLNGRLHEIADAGSPLMRGAATAVMDRIDNDDRSVLVGSWLNLAHNPASRRPLRRLLTGYLAASRGSWVESPSVDGLIGRINSVDDSLFVASLPALRGAFETTPAQEREQFLDKLMNDLDADIDTELLVPAEFLTDYATHDHEARKRLEELGLSDISFDPASRWRLILGAEPDRLPATASRMAQTLDELYGDDPSDRTGDGRVRASDRGRKGGKGRRALGVRQWSEEITALFGEDQVNEIFATAAERGRVDVLLAQGTPAPDDLQPSVDLLATVLNLRGAISEKQMANLRPIVAKLVDELSKELAARITPVFAGLAGHRPTSRPNGTLNLSATLRRNLRHVTRVDGRDLVIPVNPVFRNPVRKTSPWHLVILVDVSGSMEASTVYAAMTASILAGISTYRVSFLTFDTDVIDLSEHTADPLSLLLEIAVGGGPILLGLSVSPAS